MTDHVFSDFDRPPEKGWRFVGAFDFEIEQFPFGVQRDQYGYRAAEPHNLRREFRGTDDMDGFTAFCFDVVEFPAADFASADFVPEIGREIGDWARWRGFDSWFVRRGRLRWSLLRRRYGGGWGVREKSECYEEQSDGRGAPSYEQRQSRKRCGEIPGE